MLTSCWNKLPEEAGHSLPFGVFRSKLGAFLKEMHWPAGDYRTTVLWHSVAFDTKVRLVDVPSVLNVPDWVGD